MKAAVVIGLIGSMAQASLAFAFDLADHFAEICVDDLGKPAAVVNKQKLAKLLVSDDPAASKLYINVETNNSLPATPPKWQAIFRDMEFCASDPACLAPSPKSNQDATPDKSTINPPPVNGKQPEPNNLAARQTLRNLRLTLADVIFKARTSSRFYTPNPKMGRLYFESKDYTEHAIQCIVADPAKKPAPATKSDPVVIASPAPDRLRLRANSDDLRIKSSSDAFDGLNPASISYTADNVAGTRITKAQAALGYAFQLPFNGETPKGYSIFDGEWIPYISAQQNLTKKNGALATHGDTDNVAVGTLFKLETELDAVPGLVNIFSAQPQYLWNTKDKSEIASFRFIYQPFFVRSGETRLNIPNAIPLFGAYGANWLTLIFDLRNDVGEYTKRAASPVAALKQDSFDRAGSNFGFALSTDTSKAHVVLRITETLLYGFQGSVRWLDYFDSTLTLYLDSTNNFGFSLSYTKGADENTAERAQTYKVGFAAKF